MKKTKTTIYLLLKVVTKVHLDGLVIPAHLDGLVDLEGDITLYCLDEAGAGCPRLPTAALLSLLLH